MFEKQENSTELEKLNRRLFLGAAAAMPLNFLAKGARSGFAAEGSQQTGLIVRQKQPDNLEMPFATLDRYVTPTERFFIRNHFAMPKLDARFWKLKIEGAVRQPLEMGYEELRRLPSRTVTATLECAGNSRVFLVPRETGVPWEMGAVGNAEWTGVPLAAILEQAGLKDNAIEVVLEGTDSGTVAEPKSPGAIHFARSLPIAKTRQPEMLLAYAMNGQPLPAAHGFPLRAIIAGWYGMASVKWLKRIIVTEQPFRGFFQTLDYSYFEKQNGLPSLKPITAMQVKAAIARPALLEVVEAGKAYRMHGAAWAGENKVAKVEISTDGGKSWQPARLQDKSIPFAWRFWDFEWPVPKEADRYTLMARATDDRGRIQPMERDSGHRNYMISHVLPVEVDVR